MRKIIHGNDQLLTLAVVARPEPGPGEILIRVAAAGVNRPDLMQRAGLYPPPPGAPETLGLEVAGTVEAIGAGVRRWHEGDESGLTMILHSAPSGNRYRPGEGATKPQRSRPRRR